MSERWSICKDCDAKGYPHPKWNDCKDSEIEWLRFHLNKAKQKIKFLEEIVGMKMKGD